MSAVSKLRVFGMQSTVRIHDPVGIFTIHEKQKHFLGDEMHIGGFRYRYCYATEAITVGQICSHVMDADTIAAEKFPAAPVGAYSLSVTLAAQVAHEHANRILCITAGTGAGYYYPIKDNDATVAAGTCKLYLWRPIAVALSATDTVGVIVNDRWVTHVCDAADPVAQVPVCVAPFPVTSTYYYWGLVEGLSPILADTAGIVAGQGVMPGEANQGRGQVIAEGQEHTRPIGTALTTAAADAKALVDVHLF